MYKRYRFRYLDKRYGFRLVYSCFEFLNFCIFLRVNTKHYAFWVINFKLKLFSKTQKYRSIASLARSDQKTL